MDFEHVPNPLENQKVGFQDAVSFENLFEMIKIFGEVKGTSKTYTAEELIKKIEQVRHGHRDISFITRSHGLYETVENLLRNDKVYQKYVGDKNL